MKMIHVVPHVDEEAAGPSYSVPRLCQALAARGNEVELSCLAARGPILGVRLDLHREWPVFRSFAVSSSLAQALRRKCATVDIVHNHSLWSMVNVAAGWVVPGGRAKLVVSPRGTLSSWALRRSRWRKRLLWPLQRRVLARADLLHATSEVEYREIRALGFTAPIVIVPNGIDIPVLTDRLSSPEFRTLLFLSRIHPKKGIDRLLDAWATLERSFADWQLVIAGKGESAHEAEAKAQAVQLGLRRVQFPGPLYGEDKAAAYCASDLFVLPSHSENFGMVVAEALSYGCPVIASKGTPWEGLARERCGWWVDNDVQSLAAAMETAMRRGQADLAEMGLRGRRWMQSDFSWDAITQRMEVAYAWVIAESAGPTPPWVRTAE